MYFALSLLLLGGCNSIKFSPDFYVHDSATQTIISERGDVVSCNDPAFDRFASMHEEKIKELAALLKRAKLKKQAAELDRVLIRLDSGTD